MIACSITLTTGRVLDSVVICRPCSKNAHEIFEQNCLNCRYAYSVRGNIKVDFRMRHKDRLSFALGVSHAGARSEIPLCGTSAGVPAPTPLPTWHG